MPNPLESNFNQAVGKSTVRKTTREKAQKLW
jgi:hypothetical protein